MICLDASVAVKLVVPEVLSETAYQLYEACRMQGIRIIAPGMIRFEVTNVMRRKILRESMPERVAQESLRNFLALPINLHSPPELHAEALELASRFGMPAVYDAHYLVLAAKSLCNLWTADSRLLNTLNHRLTYVRALEDFKPGVEL